MKAKTLHFFYAKKLKIVQNQEKSLWYILKCPTFDMGTRTPASISAQC